MVRWTRRTCGEAKGRGVVTDVSAGEDGQHCTSETLDRNETRRSRSSCAKETREVGVVMDGAMKWREWWKMVGERKFRSATSDVSINSKQRQTHCEVPPNSATLRHVNVV